MTSPELQRAAPHRDAAVSHGLLGVAAVGTAFDWLLLRNRVLDHPTWVLGALVGVTLFGIALRSLGLARRIWMERARRGVRSAELTLLAGVLIALSAGLANWLFSLQGFIVLREGEAVPLQSGSHLQGFEEGPLARLAEMNLTLALVEVELLAHGSGGFFPQSLVELRRPEGEPERLTVSRQENATSGNLRFFQGAFGFAPRIVILREEETLFDRVVPFTTKRTGPSGVSFEGSFEVVEAGLQADGRVDLASLDPAMRGHATLHLTLRHEDTLLGRGSLLPGRFADIEQGYRVGFAGLEKWSEIDISRRHYGTFVLFGGAVSLLGGLLWPLAAWRGW